MSKLVELVVDGSEMTCYVARPDGEPRAGVLVCMHGPGVDAFIRDICRRLAAEGYLAVAPNFYHRQGDDLQEPWMKVNDAEAITDMKAATDFLEAECGGPLGLVGFCMGGRLAFLDLAQDTRPRTGVIFHGGAIMQARNGLQSPLDQSEHISASILGIFGDDDEDPSPADRQLIARHLDSIGTRYQFESYEGAGHAFLNFTRPQVYREAQANAAWSLCLDWLEQELT